MTTEITLSGSPDAMRQQTATIAVLALIQESCFLSVQRGRHAMCRQEALRLLGLNDTAEDAAVMAAIQASPTFPFEYHCRGAAVVCGACGSLIQPGYPSCPDCGAILEQPAGVLALPQWQARLVTRSLQVAITTSLVVGDLLMFSIHRTVRLLVLRNLANLSDLDSWEVRAREVRETVLDAWPEGAKPGKESWEYRFIRASAVFWIVAWPMLKRRFSLADVDSWNSKVIRAVAVSSQRWVDAEADAQEYAALVRAVMDAPDIDRAQAIAALAPTDVQPEPGSGKDRLVLHPPELIFERSVRTRSRSGDPWLLIALDPEEDELLAQRGVGLDNPDSVAKRFGSA